MPSSYTTVSHSSVSPCQSNQARKRNEGIQTEKEEAKLSLLLCDIILRIESLKHGTENHWISNLIQQTFRIQNQDTGISHVSVYNSKLPEKNQEGNPNYNSYKNNKISWNKLNYGNESFIEPKLYIDDRN